jgi:hypothetical protein
MKSKKHPCKNNACSQRGVMWGTDAIGLQKCDLAPPLIFHRSSCNNIIREKCRRKNEGIENKNENLREFNDKYTGK